MKKKIAFYFIILVSLTPTLVNAQKKGILYYKLNIDDMNNISPKRTENYISYFADNKSIEFLVPMVVNSTAVLTGENAVTKSITLSGSKKKKFIYKDFQSNELVLADYVEFKTFLIKDTLSNFKWKITNEHQKILKYKCTKATTTFRGRDYVAWFTDEIALQNGPWKFCGLPGLIIMLNDIENHYSFELEAIDLKTPFDSSIINIPSAFIKDKPITHSAYLALYNKKVEDLRAQSKASYQTYSNGSGFTTFSIPPLIEKF